MSEDRLDQAKALVKEGKKQEARILLVNILEDNPRNESAWLWLSACVVSDEDKRMCLEKALEINPANEKARQALGRLPQTQPATTPSPAWEYEPQPPVVVPVVESVQPDSHLEPLPASLKPTSALQQHPAASPYYPAQPPEQTPELTPEPTVESVLFQPEKLYEDVTTRREELPAAQPISARHKSSHIKGWIALAVMALLFILLTLAGIAYIVLTHYFSFTW